MQLTLRREASTAKCTFGVLFVDEQRECHTLEDIVRLDPNLATPQNEAKVADATAIPAGRYNVVVTASPRFKRDLPRLENVPGFTGILIHPGNTAVDTSGCILVGRTRGPDAIGGSRLAFAALFQKIQDALKRGEKVAITIVSAPTQV